MLQLRSGRSISLLSLDQTSVYAGLLAGTPNSEVNNGIIERALREAKDRHCVEGAEPFLIKPPRRDFMDKPGDMAELVRKSPHYIPEWLPWTLCIGNFRSTRAREEDSDYSLLTVVWFQDKFAMPILEPSLSQILSIDWELLAADIEVFGDGPILPPTR